MMLWTNGRIMLPKYFTVFTLDYYTVVSNSLRWKLLSHSYYKGNTLVEIVDYDITQYVFIVSSDSR